MFAIEATNAKKWRWVSGVFAHRTDAEYFLQSIPVADRPMQHIVKLPVNKYPVFIIEDEKFEYGDINFVRAKIQSLVPDGDEDYIHMNVYALREDFAPAEPGSDSMGELLHWHITDWTLVPPRSTVFDQELAEIVSAG
jgi:hypothetical protein